jgi:6-phosphofructokinase 1
MKFGILTGGGDCPGMNSFIRAVVRTSLNIRPQTSVWGVVDGWKGLVDNNYRRMSKLDVAGLTSRGGTILGTTRVPELVYDKDLQETVARNLHDNGFHYLFVCGGNGSLKASNVLNQIARKEGLRTKVLVAPGSIDNDVCNNFGSSIGFFSAIDKSLDMLEWIRDTASSHRRVYLVRSMGRKSAYLALYAAIGSGAEYAIMPNEDVDFEHLATIIAERDKDTRIIVSEAYPKSLEELKAIMEDIFRLRGITREIRSVDMGYFQRGGKTSVIDILRASWLGYRMVMDAFNGCDSGFYTSFYTGHSLPPIPLEDAANDEYSMHEEIPREFIEFALALR